VQLNGVLSEGGAEGSCGVAVHAIALWHLRLVVLAIGLDERLYVAQRSVEAVFDLLEHGEVVTGSY
jgi:hypothetical protein